MGCLVFFALGGSFLTSRPTSECTNLKHSKRPKQKPKRRNVKQELRKWVAQTAKSRKRVFSCRVIGRKRTKHVKRDVKHLAQFCWWLPCATQFQHREPGVRVFVSDPQLSVPHLDWQLPLQQDPFKPQEWEQDSWHVSTLRGGAGGAASTRRRRVQWADTEDESEASDSLAHALSGFLEQWSSRQVASRPLQRLEDPLAKQLLQVLKKCLNQHAPDQVINEVSKIINRGNRHKQLLHSPDRSTFPPRKHPRSTAAFGERLGTPEKSWERDWFTPQT